jgi:protein-S-isoprenylcysteine O-methyltransferase Ste14
MFNRFLGTVDAAALVALIALVPVPLFWLLIHPAITFWRRLGRRALWLGLPVWVGAGILIAAGRHWIFSTRIRREPWTWVAGFALLALAAYLDPKTRREFGFRRLVGLPEVQLGHPAGGVVQSGVYGRVRHPRYVAYMLTLLGFAFLTGAAGYFSLAFLTVLMYQVVAPLEERELRQHYGQAYEDYAQRVPRFMPRFGRKREPKISS